MTLNLTINTVDTSVSVSANSLTANAIGASYQWLDCNNNFAVIPGATNQIYSATVSGNYTSAITQGGCTDTSACYNIIITKISEYSKGDNFSAYPNPFSSHTTLQTDFFLKNATLTVYNSFGQAVKQIKNISGQTVVLSRDNLPNGLYFIRLSADHKTLAINKLVIVDK